jgi:hypothetical protein
MSCSAGMFRGVTTGVLVAAAITVFGHHPWPTTFWLISKAMVVLAMSDSVLDGAGVTVYQVNYQIIAKMEIV